MPMASQIEAIDTDSDRWLAYTVAIFTRVITVVGFFVYICFADMYADVYLSVQGPTKIIFWPNFYTAGEI